MHGERIIFKYNDGVLLFSGQCSSVPIAAFLSTPSSDLIASSAPGDSTGLPAIGEYTLGSISRIRKSISSHLVNLYRWIDG